MSTSDVAGSLSEKLADKISNRTAIIGVIGLGYVGLPLLHAFIEAGFTTIGFDVDQKKVDSLAAGESYIRHVPSEWVEHWVRERKI